MARLSLALTGSCSARYLRLLGPLRAHALGGLRARARSLGSARCGVGSLRLPVPHGGNRPLGVSPSVIGAACALELVSVVELGNGFALQKLTNLEALARGICCPSSCRCISGTRYAFGIDICSTHTCRLAHAFHGRACFVRCPIAERGSSLAQGGEDLTLVVLHDPRAHSIELIGGYDVSDRCALLVKASRIHLALAFLCV